MMIVGKKKLTPKVAEAIQKHNFANKEEQNYFFYLLKYSQSSSVKEKQIYSQKMMSILKAQHTCFVIQESEDFVSDPLLPRLLSLFSYEDISKTIESFAHILDTSKLQIENALMALKQLGLVQETANPDIWTSNVETFKVSDNRGSINLRKFHEKSLQEALQAFDLPKNTRSYKSLVLPMNEENFNLFLQSLDEFSSEQIVRHNTQVYQGKRLYQVNFNIYPVAADLNEAIS